MAIITKADFGGSGGTSSDLGDRNLGAGTSAPPADQEILYNNASAASVTSIFIDDNDLDGADRSASIAKSTSGILTISDKENGEDNYDKFEISGVAANTGYSTFTVVWLESKGTVSGEVNVGVDITGSGGGAVSSVFGRTGAVVATSGDYEASEVTNAFDKTTDDTDDITESATKEFLDNSAPQTIAGNKSFTGQVKGGANSGSFSATKTFDMNNGNYQKMVVTANITSLALSNKVNGSSYQIVLEIGGSGTYTIPQAAASFGNKTDNSVDDSVASWYPTTVGSKIIYNIGVDPDGDTWYSIETITI